MEKDRAALYYFHIADTSEDSCYLPDAEEHRLFELTYDDRLMQFGNLAYDVKAAALLAEMEYNGTDPELLKEVLRCLHLGCVRADWTLTSDEIQKRIQSSKHLRDKNYCVCMKRLCSFHRKAL